MRQVEVELNGMAHMRQRRMLNVTDGATVAQILALAVETMNDEIWDYRGIQEDSVQITINTDSAPPTYVINYWSRQRRGREIVEVTPEGTETVERAFTRVTGVHHQWINTCVLKKEA